ncbi:MAG TPA: SDR family NAD(P)-dependent oxidoreductase [bacterium]|nr:SDR family NAD(P)-dependent oxidoreductase [bacterium]
MEFAGKVVWLTGGGGRIGPVIATVFGREGAAVGVCDLDGPRAEAAASAVRKAGGRAAAFAGDVSREADVERLLAGVTEALGPVDILVNCHGVSPNVPVLEMDLATWQSPFLVNTQGCFLTCRAAARQMVDRGARGCIINISSGAATSGRPGSAAYCASKAAINMLTQVLATELGPLGIRVNAVTPGLVTDTPLRRGEAGHPYLNLMIEMTPLGRTGIPSDVAEAVAALASDRLPWVTGANLEVTGGSHCGRTNAPLTRRLGTATRP